MKRKVGIFIYNDVEIFDFTAPYEIFSSCNKLFDNKLFDVFVFAETNADVMATGGLLIKPKYSFEDCPDLDILVVPGGVGSREVIKDNYILSMINKISKKSEILLSICSGVLILGKNGLFDNKKYCTHHAVYNEAEQIISNGIPCKEDRFIKVAGRIFSSAGVTAGIDASFAVIYDLYGSDKVEKTKTYMEYSSY